MIHLVLMKSVFCLDLDCRTSMTVPVPMKRVYFGLQDFYDSPCAHEKGVFWIAGLL